MVRTLSQSELLAAIHHDAVRQPDQPIHRAVASESLVALYAARVGLASRPCSDPKNAPETIRLPIAGASARETADHLLDPGVAETDQASLAMAAANSLLSPPPRCSPAFGQEVMAARGQGKNVVVIGHFPFVEAVRPAFANFWVLEKRPQAGDCDAAMAATILPQADVVAITATTLLNGTLAGLLNLCRESALVILLGPTTPFAPSLFDYGIDVLAGCDCPDPAAALDGVGQGHIFRDLPQARQTTWEAPVRF
jgi:uncharacterized protein